jgi:hypothetical protein
LLFCHFCISSQYSGRGFIFLGLSSQALDVFRRLFFGPFLFDTWFDICMESKLFQWMKSWLQFRSNWRLLP